MKKQTMFSAILALAALVGASFTAQAADAFATDDVNVRSGPGTSYAVVGVLGAGTRVQMNQCREGWCSVEQGNLNGWASQSYLDKTNNTVVVVPVPIIIHQPRFHKPHRPYPKRRCKIAPGVSCR